MLVLKILEGQHIYIDDGAITLTLLERTGNYAKIGIDAPESVKILREALCPEGPARCCRCGGKLPPPSSDGMRVSASTGCLGVVDHGSGRCGAFVSSALWGDVPAGQERKDGAA